MVVRDILFRQWLRLAIAAASLFLVLAAAAGAQAETLVWTGCGVVKKAFMDELAAAYETKTGDKLTLSGGGATKGIRSVSAKTSDLSGTCRHWLFDAAGAIVPEEAKAKLIQVSWDAVVLIANKANTIAGISLEQLKAVLEGRITNWKELGGADKPIALVERDEPSSGVGHMYRLLLFNNPDYQVKARSLKVKSSESLEVKVESIETALGLDGFSSAIRGNLKLLALDGTAPSKESIASGEYPLYRPLYLVVNTDAPGKASTFIEFVLSAEGQAIISKTGAVNLEEGKLLGPLWAAKKKQFGL